MYNKKNELIGHNTIKERIRIAIQSATLRNTALPHILLTGSAGCGKTTTASWISELGDYFYMPISPLSLKTKNDVYSVLDKLNIIGYNECGDKINKIIPTILFFDEIHQMPVIAQEILGIAMENFQLETNEVGKVLWLPYFTVIGATTDDGKLTKPFRDRFKMVFMYEHYDNETMTEILKYHLIKKKLKITYEAIDNIVNRSRGTPRIMLTYLDNIRDYVITLNNNIDDIPIITEEICNIVFKTLHIDKYGLTKTEIKILKSLYVAKIPIGIENLAIITNESIKNIQNTIEPFLIKKEFIVRISRGRTITEKGIKYLEQENHLDTPVNNKIAINYDYQRT